MLVSTLGKYGLNIMVDVATHGSEDAPTSTSEVCRRLGITTKYAEQIINQLTHKRLLKSKRGSSGGYYLAKPAKTYTVKNIVSACERMPIRVVSGISGSKKMIRSAADFWVEFDDSVHAFMANRTLDTFIKS